MFRRRLCSQNWFWLLDQLENESGEVLSCARLKKAIVGLAMTFARPPAAVVLPVPHDTFAIFQKLSPQETDQVCVILKHYGLAYLPRNPDRDACAYQARKTTPDEKLGRSSLAVLSFFYWSHWSICRTRARFRQYPCSCSRSFGFILSVFQGAIKRGRREMQVESLHYLILELRDG